MNTVPLAFVGQLPPPFHGQAIANECLLHGDYERLRIYPIRVDLSDRLCDVGRPRFDKFQRLWATRKRIARVAAESGADTVYYSMGFTNLVGAVKDAILLRECRRRFQRVVVHLHTGSTNLVLDQLGTLGRLTFGKLFQSIDAWILLSPEMNHFDSLFSPRQVFHLPNGIQVPAALEADNDHLPAREPADVPTILFMSNLFESKGTDLLLRAAGILRRKSSLPFRVRLVGNWPSQQRKRELENLIRDEQLHDCVQLVGPLVGDAKWGELQAADIFCLPTHYSGEAMPLSILEAMACGVPVVSTLWRAIPDLVQDGVNGLLIPCRNVEALADRLETLVKDVDLRVSLGMAARRTFREKHTVQQFRARFEKTMLEAMGCTAIARRLPSTVDHVSSS